MQLTNEFFHGHAQLTVDENGFATPYRFTAERIAFYRTVMDAFGNRAQLSSGISLEFTTSADCISFELCITNQVRRENSIAVYENGRLTQIITVTEDDPKTKIVYHKKQQQKAGQPCRYAFYLPTMATAGVKNLSAEDATPVPRHPKTLLALGDSITQGVYTQASGNAYPSRLARRFGLNLCNQGIGGYYFDANSIENVTTPDVITLAYGINDINHYGDASIILENAKACFEKIAACYPNVPLVCLTPLWKGDFTPVQFDIYQEVTKGLLCLAAQYGATAINGYEAFPHDVQLFTDGTLHPNDDGFAIMADFLGEKIAQVL